MAGGPRPGGDVPGGILDLLRLASDRPGEARAKAHAILAAGPAPYEASVAHQAIGMLHREFGELDTATAELTTAVRLARASGSAEREADVLATLGVTLTYRGRSRRGLAALDRSLALAGGEAAARVLVPPGHRPRSGCSPRRAASGGAPMRGCCCSRRGARATHRPPGC
jgi:hypothetical protein